MYFSRRTIYLNAFTNAISSALRSPDTDFVRHVASKAGIQRSVSKMVVSGLSSGAVVVQSPVAAVSAEPVVETIGDDVDKKADIVDPNNPKIIMIYDELAAKDTESYYSILCLINIYF